MQTSRINVLLDKQEALALMQDAKSDYRHPHEQARYLLREALRQRGRLPAEDQHPEGVHHDQPSDRPLKNATLHYGGCWLCSGQGMIISCVLGTFI